MFPSSWERPETVQSSTNLLQGRKLDSPITQLITSSKSNASYVSRDRFTPHLIYSPKF